MIVWHMIMVTLFLDNRVIGLSNRTDVDKLELKLLNVIFRHGEKVPQKELQNYPGDPNANYSYFPVDDGDLTNVGKRRMYEIGENLRKIYGGFLGAYYLPSHIYARSTDVARTQMSLQLVLAGLFPPVKEQIWNAKMRWQPVSTFSLPSVYDFLFFPAICSLNVNAIKKVSATDSVKQIVNKYKDDLEYIANHSGKPIEMSHPLVHTLLNVLMLHNLFEEQVAHNLTLPKWTKTVYPKVMEEISMAYMNLRSHNQELRRYNGGLLLREISENIKKVRNGTLRPHNRKAFLYSAHEFNIVAFARVLNLSEPAYPRQGSTFIIEVLQDKSENFYIRIILWTGNESEYINLRIPKCSEPCPFEKFLKIYEDVIPTIEELNQC